MSDRRKSFTEPQKTKNKKNSIPNVRRQLFFPAKSKPASASAGGDSAMDLEDDQECAPQTNGDTSFETSSCHSTPGLVKRNRISPPPVLKPVRNNKTMSNSKPNSKLKKRSLSTSAQSSSILDFVSSQNSVVNNDSKFESQSLSSDPSTLTYPSFISGTPVRRSSFVAVPSRNLGNSENSVKAFSVPIAHQKAKSYNIQPRKVRDSTPDSICEEINSHFRPIRSAPKTPPKRLANGKYMEHKLIVSTPVRHSLVIGDKKDEELPSTSAKSSGLTIVDRVEHMKKAKAEKFHDFDLSSSSQDSSVQFIGAKINCETNRANSIVSESESEGRPSIFSKECLSLHLGGLIRVPGEKIPLPFPMDSISTESENEDDLNRSFNFVEETDRCYVLAEAEELMRLKKKAKQEAEDLQLAKLLQANVDRGLEVIRSRKSSERYSIRSWLNTTKIKTEKKDSENRSTSEDSNVSSKRLRGSNMSSSSSTASSPRRSTRIATGKYNSDSDRAALGRKRLKR